MQRRVRLTVLVDAFRLIRNAAGRLVGASLAIDVIGAAANAAMLVIAGRILGLLAVGTSWDEVLPWLVGAALALAITSVTSSLHSDLISLGAEHTEAHAVGEVLQASAEVPFGSFDQPSFYDQFRRAYEGGSEHAWSIVYNALTMVRALLDMLAIVIVLAFIAPVLIAIGVVAYLPLTVAAMFNNQDRYEFSWDETEGDRRRSYLEGLLSERQPAKEIRAYRTQPMMLRQHAALWQARLSRLARVVRATALRSAVGYLVSSLVVTSALAVVVWLTIRGDLSIDEAGVGVLGVRQLSNAVTRTSGNFESLHQGAQFLGDHRDFCARARELAEPDDEQAASEPVDEVRLEDVSFRYADTERNALSGVDLTLRPDELTAVVGANGSGKTTLLMILAALYPPSAGRLLWNGGDVAHLTPAQRHAQLSVLFQDYVQYHFTVRENVVFGSQTERDVGRPLDVSGATPFVARLPEGENTQLGKDFADGAELSIGQWQRLALARALYRPSSVLLLDEPASALDPEAEVALLERLRAERRGRCTVFVSHRFASVRQADRIIVLDEGRVIEDGSHDELVARGGAYSALYRAQVSAMLGEDAQGQG